jgi:CheY-like chemotaxis protein
MNVNVVLSDVERMLRRIIGEDVRLKVSPGEGVHNVRADPGQFEQIIFNLVTNARDAMPGGGALTIETQNVELDEAYCAEHAEVEPGCYVMLAVSDTGCGMDEATKQRAFEPFFSTKGERGTGLGLATVFGIVRQHGGHIWCYSELGKGTTFKVYLPVVDAPVETRGTPDTDGLAGGKETILIAEDDAAILNMAVKALEQRGYTVLSASRGEQAVEIARAHTDPVHLLLTDVVLPDAKGPEIAGRVRQCHPETRVIFTSGYTDNVIAHHGVVDRTITFIQKPYRLIDLLRAIRETLAETPSH